MSLYLSKSKYCNAVQCPKMLWMKSRKEYDDKFDSSVMNEAVLETGNQVGDRAMGLFGDYVEIPYSNPSDMIKATKEEIEKGTSIIAEASFSYNGLFCSVDILKRTDQGSFEIYEVKSSTEVKAINEDDAAYQYYILTKLGYEITRVCIVHINSSYVRYGDLDLSKLFHIEDITRLVQGKQAEVDYDITILESYMKEETEPEQEIGQHCFAPYKCGYFNYCSEDLPKPNVFDLVGMQTRTKFKHYNNGHVSFEELYRSGELDEKYMIQIDHTLHDVEDRLDIVKIREFVDGLEYPLYFLDFETYQEAIPEYDGCSPYEQMPFQYSLHILYEDGVLEHKEFLADINKDPRRSVAEHLCEDIPKGVCSVAYNMSFEKGRIKKLAQLYPDLRKNLMDMYDNMYDLMPIFKNKDYYKKEMEGSYSIKKVLPALFPDDLELDYNSLPGVKKGDEASRAYKEMKDAIPEEIARTREELLAYCKLDTLAMVKIWQKLNEVI